MRRLVLSLWLLFALPLPAGADVVVIANARSGTTPLTRDQVVDIYLGRYRQLPTGPTARPIDLPPDDPWRISFYRRLVNKSSDEINAYWARLIFTGKARPPLILDDAESVLRRVATEADALAYIDRSKVDKRVKIVFEFGDLP